MKTLIQFFTRKRIGMRFLILRGFIIKNAYSIPSANYTAVNPRLGIELIWNVHDFWVYLPSDLGHQIFKYEHELTDFMELMDVGKYKE